MNLVQRVCLVDATGHISDEMIRDVADAVDQQVANEFQEFWGIKGKVTGLSHAGELRPGDWPVFVVTETEDGSAGFHKTSHGQPYAEVAEARGEGYEWSMVASHEILEMLVDPSGNRLVPGKKVELHQGQLRDTTETVGYLLEICDPCEDPNCAYKKQVRNKEVIVSDFYTPAYFEPKASPDVIYSYKGNIMEPRRVRRGGYLTWWDPEAQALCQVDHIGSELRMNYLPPNQAHMSLREQSDQYMRPRVSMAARRTTRSRPPAVHNAV